MAEDDIDDEELSELLDSALSDIDTAKESVKALPQVNNNANQTSNNGVHSTEAKQEPQAASAVDYESEAAKLAQLFSSVGMNDVDNVDEENLEKLLSVMQSSLNHILQSEPAGETEQSSNRTTSPPSNCDAESAKGTDNPLLKALEELSSNLPEFNEADFGASASCDPDVFLSSMLAPLLARNVVYEPLKSLTEKYPTWLNSQNSGPEKESRMRQAELMRKVCLEYEHSRGENGNLDPSQIQKVAALLESAMKEGPPPPELIDSDPQQTNSDLPECKPM